MTDTGPFALHGAQLVVRLAFTSAFKAMACPITGRGKFLAVQSIVSGARRPRVMIFVRIPTCLFLPAPGLRFSPYWKKNILWRPA